MPGAPPQRLVLATRNDHKVREVRRILAPFGIEVRPLPAAVTLPPEDGDTFEANALGKARAAAAALAAAGSAGGAGIAAAGSAGEPGVAAVGAAGDAGIVAAVIADDSGIEAAALGGRPGVRSARYAGEGASDAENLAKLLAEAPAGSALRYVCALAYVELARPQSRASQADRGAERERVFYGCCAGALAERPRGEAGFGYDPAFLPDDGPPGLTMAELSDADKDAISHRGRALRALAGWLLPGR